MVAGQHGCEDQDGCEVAGRSRVDFDEGEECGSMMRGEMRSEGQGRRAAARVWRIRSKVLGAPNMLAGSLLAILFVCTGFSGTAQAYLLQTTMWWERIGATPQYLRSDAARVYNGPCGFYTPDYSQNPQCGNLIDHGIIATPAISQGQYPRRYLMRQVIQMVIDRRLWSEFLQVATPSSQTYYEHGLYCRDITQGQERSGNCLSDSPTGTRTQHFVVNETADGNNILQFQEIFDYQPGNGVNSDIFLSLGLVPENVTFGFNYTAGRYPMCSSLTGLATPTCYCHTAECTVASESSASFPEWTLTSTMTFSSNANQFTGGVTPTTDHHSPRISLPPIVYVPYMKPDENTTFFLSASAVDEDGDTTVTWSSDAGVVSVTPSGEASVGPLSARAPGTGFPYNTGYSSHFLFRARVTATDPVLADPQLSSTMEFHVKSCAFGGPVPVNQRWDGSGLYTFAGGLSTPQFVTIGQGRCVEASGVAVIPTVYDRTECLSRSLTFEEVWVTAPQSHFQCVVGEPCEASFTAVQFDFTTDQECWWSGEAGGRRCADLMSPSTGVFIDASQASQSGEHQEFADQVGFASRATTRIFPFRGRSRNAFAQPNPYYADIGRKITFCAAAKSNATDPLVNECWSTPHCLIVEVLGHRPETISPSVTSSCPDRTTSDISQYLAGACPDIYLCQGADTQSEIEIQARDLDYGETVSVKIDALTNLGENLGDAVNGYSASLINVSTITYPMNDPLVNTYCRARAVDPTLSIAQVPAVAALSSVDCAQGLMKINVNLAISATKSPINVLEDARGYKYAEYGDDKVLCYTITDNQQAVWGRGLNNYYSRCHIVRLRGAPVFLANDLLPLDSPFDSIGAVGLGSGEKTISVTMGVPMNFTMRARDPNFEDSITVLFLQDPGVPLDAVISDQECVDHGTRSNLQDNGIYKTYENCTGGVDQAGDIYCPTVPSPCSEAHRTVSWTPQPGSEGRTFQICSVAKDDKGFCSSSAYRRDPACPWAIDGTSCALTPILGAAERATVDGFYSTPLCVNIFVTPPQPYWLETTVPTEGEPVQKLGHVGCEVRYTIAATDPNYRVAIVVSESTPLPPGATLVTISEQGVNGANVTDIQFRWTPSRGMEGSTYRVCFDAFPLVTYTSNLSPEMQESRVGLNLPTRCFDSFIRRCKYCVGPEETLQTKMKLLSEDMNWLRLWAANGNDDGDPLTAIVEDPGLLSTGLLDGVTNGQVMNIGPVYRLVPGETLYSVAARFRTTVKSLLDLNPDIESEATVRDGQELCMVPCTF